MNFERVRAGATVRVAAMVGAVLAGTGLAGCSGEDDGVAVGVVGTEDVAEVVDAPGSVVATATATVSASGTGTVARLDVTEGQRVQAGDVLFVVDSPQAQEQLAQAREADAALVVDPAVPGVSLGGEQSDARAAAAQAFAEARVRAEAIADPEVRESTLLAIDTAEANYELSVASSDAVANQVQAGVAALADAVGALGEAQRIQTRAAVTAAQQAVDALTVTAPISGTVSLTAAGGSGGAGAADLSDAASLLSGGGGVPEDLGGLLGGGGGSQVTGLLRAGQPVSSGQPVLTVTDDSALSVAAQVDETDVLLVSAGTPAEVVLDALPGEPVTAEVISIDPAPTLSARGGVAFTVRVPLPDTVREGLLPGMSAIVGLTVREAPDVPVVPATAVVRRDGGDAVWEVDDEGRARLRSVELGVLGDGIVEVVSGVDDGDRIVTSGADLVSEGQEVG
ncbi:MAG: efflux RND transporter periplasmic adaptor subunit [Kineosporiaceae bacterium]